VVASLPCEIIAAACSTNTAQMEVAAKQKKVNNQPEVAVMTKVAAAVVAWHQTAMRHLCGRFKWKWLQSRKEKVNNQLEVPAMTKVAAAVVAWCQTAM